MSTREFPASGFSKINVKWAMDVEITRADNYSVVINGSDTQLKNMTVSVEGDKLNINYNLNLVSFFAAPFSRISARITLPELRELNISGASNATVQGFKSQSDFGMNVSGASHLELHDISTGNVNWELSGASHVKGQISAASDFNLRINGASTIDLEGAAREMSVEAYGASHLDLGRFSVQNAKIRLTGASHSFINISGKLDVALEGASHLDYKGQPTMGDIKITGASSLNRR
jgi:hypothetical protein